MRRKHEIAVGSSVYVRGCAALVAWNVTHLYPRREEARIVCSRTGVHRYVKAETLYDARDLHGAEPEYMARAR